MMPSGVFFFFLHCRLITFTGRTTVIQLFSPQKGFMVVLSLFGIFSEALLNHCGSHETAGGLV